MMKNTLLLLSIFFVITGLSAQTPAHQKSSYAIIDPAYNTQKLYPQPVTRKEGSSWIYSPTELESWRLQVLRNRKDSAKLKVGYPGTYHTAADNASFRLNVRNEGIAAKLEFRAVGKGTVLINEKEISSFESGTNFHVVSLPENVKIKTLQFDLKTSAEPPALLIDNPVFSTSQNEWEWKTEGEEWQLAFHFTQTTSGVPPAQAEDPSVNLTPLKKTDDLYDFGKELFGYVFIHKTEKPLLTAGESAEEALDSTNKDPEQSTELIQLNKGLWRSKSLVAFRYVRVHGTELKDIKCQAFFYPVQYRGAFACSDSVLTRVWMTSAYTLHLCMHDFLIMASNVTVFPGPVIWP